MIEPVERYKVVTSNLQYFNDKIIDSFKLFIQLVSAVTGGFLWLKTQTGAVDTLNLARGVAPVLMFLIGVSTIWLIYVNLSSWWGYRQAESELLNGVVPPPTFPRAARAELVMTAIVVLTTGVGVWYFSQ